MSHGHDHSHDGNSHGHNHSHGPLQGPGPHGQQITPEAPTPTALAVAAFLRSSPQLKSRTCILADQRKQLFRGFPSQISGCLTPY